MMQGPAPAGHARQLIGCRRTARAHTLQGSAFERALQQMMDGSLEGHSEVEREPGAAPAWMAGDPKTFSEEQLRQWREWQAREKAFVEERVRRQGEGAA
jgi:hypothetical protein